MTPLDLYLQIRESIGKKPLPHHPFFSMYQPLTALRAWEAPSCAERIAPVLAESGRVPLCTEAVVWPQGTFPNIRVSCQLAVLWASLGEKMEDTSLTQAAKRLAGFLSPIVSEGLMTLWTPEREYREAEDRHSSELFLQLTGQGGSVLESDAFPFCVQNNICINPTKDVLQDPSIGYELLRGEDAVIAISAAGWQTGAGAARIGDVEIPAFGPHLAPLSDGELFGIGPGEDGWFCAHADKEVWLRASGAAGRRSVSLSLDSVGVQSEKPMAFVFYIRADECIAGGRVFKPRSLARFSGTADAVEFTAKSSKISFSSDPGLKIEIIPLTGDKDFWGASFLLAVWLPSFHATTGFRFQ